MSRLLCLAELLRHVRRDKSTRSWGWPRRTGLSTAPGVLCSSESLEGTAVSTSSQQVAHRLSTGINRSVDPGAPFGPPRARRRSSSPRGWRAHRLPASGCGGRNHQPGGRTSVAAAAFTAACSPRKGPLPCSAGPAIPRRSALIHALPTTCAQVIHRLLDRLTN